jgi:glycosyltransferase involved in cell wall biosynthesis
LKAKSALKGDFSMPLTFLQYITPSRLGGAEYFFLRLVPHLLKKGHRVLVVTKRDTPLRHEVEKLVPLGVELHAWHTHGKFDPQTLSKLVKLIKSERVDIINTHLTTATWQGALAGKLTNRPVVAFVHATDRKTWFQHADHLIAVSQGVRSSLLEQGVPDKKIEVLFYGINLEKYVPTISKIDAKIRLGLAPSDRTIGVAASLIPRKGHRYLLEALKNIQPRTGPIHAIFAGEGELEAELKKQVQDLGLEKTVHFLGFRRDMPEILSALDAFVLPSFKEGLSIAVMEAMALKIPVVVTNIAGMPEVVHHGETGLLVTPGNVEELGNAVESVFTLPNEAQRMADNGRAFLEQHFEQHICLDAMDSYFRRIDSEWKGRDSVRNVRTGAFSRSHIPRTNAEVLQSVPLSKDALGKEPLHILQVIAPSKIAGAERATIALSRGLEARGNEVDLLVKFGHELVEAARIEGVQTAGLRFGGKLNLLAVRRMMNWLKEHPVDLVATHLSTASLWGTIAARSMGIPSVATVHALNSKTCFVFADLIIAVSHAVKTHLVEQGIDPNKIHVVYNGINMEKFKSVTPIEEAKRKLGFESDDQIIGVVAHLSTKKGHAWFMESMAPVLSANPKARLVFIGDGPRRADLESLANNLGITSRVTFAGFQEDVVPWIEALDILVLPTIGKEGFGLVLVEAGAMGKPVIGTSIGGIAEVIDNGNSGFVVEPNDMNAMRSAVERLLLEPQLRVQMGENGKRRAKEKFSSEIMIAETEKVYRKLLHLHREQKLDSSFNTKGLHNDKNE